MNLEVLQVKACYYQDYFIIYFILFFIQKLLKQSKWQSEYAKKQTSQVNISDKINTRKFCFKIVKSITSSSNLNMKIKLQQCNTNKYNFGHKTYVNKILNSYSLNETESMDAVLWNNHSIPHTATHFKSQLLDFYGSKNVTIIIISEIQTCSEDQSKQQTRQVNYWLSKLSYPDSHCDNSSTCN